MRNCNTYIGYSGGTAMSGGSLGAPPQTPEFSAWVPPAGGLKMDRAESSARPAAVWQPAGARVALLRSPILQPASYRRPGKGWRLRTHYPFHRLMNAQRTGKRPITLGNKLRMRYTRPYNTGRF